MAIFTVTAETKVMYFMQHLVVLQYDSDTRQFMYFNE